jgi:hypothetical protein
VSGGGGGGGGGGGACAVSDFSYPDIAVNHHSCRY